MTRASVSPLCAASSRDSVHLNVWSFSPYSCLDNDSRKWGCKGQNMHRNHITQAPPPAAWRPPGNHSQPPAATPVMLCHCPDRMAPCLCEPCLCLLVVSLGASTLEEALAHSAHRCQQHALESISFHPGRVGHICTGARIEASKGS